MLKDGLNKTASAAKVSNTAPTNLFFCSLLVKIETWLLPDELKFEAKTKENIKQTNKQTIKTT